MRATRIAGWVATTAGALLVAFVVVISALRAQEAAVDPVAAGAAEEVPAPTVVTMDGAPAAVVPAPSDATVEEVRAVAEQSAENLKAVASGEVSLAAATRDPTSGAPDTGEGGLFWVLSLIVGLVIRPITDKVLRAIPWVDDDLAGPIYLGLLLVVYSVAWAALHAPNPALPQDWTAWMLAAFSAAGMGTASSSRARAAISGMSGGFKTAGGKP